MSISQTLERERQLLTMACGGIALVIDSVEYAASATTTEVIPVVATIFNFQVPVLEPGGEIPGSTLRSFMCPTLQKACRHPAAQTASE